MKHNDIRIYDVLFRKFIVGEQCFSKHTHEVGDYNGSKQKYNQCASVCYSVKEVRCRLRDGKIFIAHL